MTPPRTDAVDALTCVAIGLAIASALWIAAMVFL